MKEMDLTVGDMIQISYLTGEITIESHEKQSIEIDSNEEESIDCSFVEGNLIIKGIPQQKEIIPNKSLFSGIFNKGEQATEQSQVAEKQFETVIPKVKMKLKVPKCTIKKIVSSSSIHLNIHGISDEVSIENLGELHLFSKEVKQLTLLSTGNIEGKIEDSTSLFIESSGKNILEAKSSRMEIVKLDLNGENDVIIKGSVDILDVDLSGQGDVIVKGKVLTKSISTSVMCDVIIKD